LVPEVDAIMELLEVCHKIIKLQTSNWQVLSQKKKKKAWLWGARCFQW
jgi:hypothetical protein